MNDLVFIEPKRTAREPYTTSLIISEHTGVEHRKLKTVIRNHKSSLEALGISSPYRAENNKNPKGLLVSYQPESNVGILAYQMPKTKGRGRPETIYRLNEQQATFLITLLKNTPVVVEFKKELVRQFFLMREELTKRQLNRSALTVNRRELTDSIKDNPDKGKWSYKLYTDLAYKTALGKTSGQIRKERGADRRAGAVELLSADELESVTKVSYQIAVLHDMGMSYEEIQAMYRERLTPALQSTTKGG